MWRFVFIFCGFFLFGQDLYAQSFDMRAYSRQRGFKAYKVKPVAPVYPVPRVKEQPRQKNAENEETSVRPAEPENKIQQTGVKVFQEKDEAKVMNFDVKNPEFDKLSDYKKQDLMKRITFEQNTD